MTENEKGLSLDVNEHLLVLLDYISPNSPDG